MKVFKLEWSNTCDVADLFYQEGFKQIFYIDSDKGRMCGALTEATYPLDEDAITNGEGEVIPVFQVLVKRYNLSFVATEVMTDALSLLSLHDDVFLTDPEGNQSKINEVEVTVGSWEGRYAPVVISFTLKRFVKTKRCRNMTIALPA